MNTRAGIWIAAGVLGAAGIYFILRQQASAAGAGTTGMAPAGAAGAANLAQATGITAPTLSAPTLASLPSGIQQLTNPLGQPIYITSALSAPTASTIGASGSFWATLSPAPNPPAGGWLIDPAGSQAPVSLLPWRVDGSGNLYTMWGVDVYQAQGPNAQGNYMGLPVAGTSSAVSTGF
jgi:hypothetical protein